MALNIFLYRYYSVECTLGILKIEGVHHDPIYTLENPWKDNAAYISCIPTGTYECLPYSSDKYPDVWELQNVIGRSKILIHAGNYERNTQGCILVGMESCDNGEKMVAKSRKALNFLRDCLDFQPFILTILEI